MRKYPPRFRSNVDTLRVKRATVAVHYSLDTALQRLGRNLFKRYHPKYGSLVAMHPSTGRILALVAYNNPEEPPLASDLYCQNLFPAASIIKTVTAAAAIERAGLDSKSTLRTAGSNHTLYKSQLAKELKWHREVTFEEAFAYSINPVFGRIGIHMLGPAVMREYLAKFGFNAQIPFELRVGVARAQVSDSSFAVAELACGFNQTTVMAPLYGALLAATVSHDGHMPVPTVVDSVVDLRTGARLYEPTHRSWRRPVRAAAAAELRKLMRSVTRFGTARNSFAYVKRSGRFADIEYGGKTGNVDKPGIGRVDWFTGYARHVRDPQQEIAACVVTAHGAYWTVHSSFVAAEAIRTYIRNVQMAQAKLRREAQKRGGTMNVSAGSAAAAEGPQ
jgi:cell division protein FtsI/penicillin-binding protein 2